MRTLVLKARQRHLNSPPTSLLAQVKDWASIIQSLATVGALIVGAYWFAEQRQRLPRLTIEQYVHHLALTPSYVLLTVDITVKNNGSVLVELPSGEVRVTRVLPLPTDIDTALNNQKVPIRKGEHEPAWSWIDGRNTEPTNVEAGETATLHEEFIVPTTIRVASVYTYLRNVAVVKGEVGWSNTVLYNIKDGKILGAKAGD